MPAVTSAIGRSFAVTPHDTNDIVAVGFYVGGAGDVAIMCEDDAAAVTLTGIPAGTFVPVPVKRILATGTTATGIVGFDS